MAHAKHEEIRQRYHCCCGYCGVSEADTGGELTVDHYCPVSAGGDDSSNNLVYACFRCNTHKADFVPSAEDLEHGRRILHPLVDRISVHLRENEQTGMLEPLTDSGRFHVFLLRLNRPQLIQRRIQQRITQRLAETRLLLIEENKALRRRITVLEDYLRLLNIQRRRETEA